MTFPRKVLTAGVDANGKPFIVDKFTVRYTKDGKVDATFATCEGRELQDKFLAGLSDGEEDQKADRFAAKVVEKLAGVAVTPVPVNALPHPDEVLDVGEVAKILNIPVKTVRQLCGEGRMPGATKPGREWRIPGWGIRKTFETASRR